MFRGEFRPGNRDIDPKTALLLEKIKNSRAALEIEYGFSYLREIPINEDGVEKLKTAESVLLITPIDGVNLLIVPKFIAPSGDIVPSLESRKATVGVIGGPQNRAVNKLLHRCLQELVIYDSDSTPTSRPPLR